MGVSTASSSRIRAFTAEDIPAVADLHRRVFGLADTMSEDLLQAYRAYFTRVFLDHPWQDLGTQSLVYEERSGITGFVGLPPRRLMLDGEPVRAKIVTQFVVAPESRGLGGAKLLRTALAGPEDLTYTDEANSDMRRLWEGLGGATALLSSMQWMCALRPSLLAQKLMLHKTGGWRLPLAVAAAGTTWWLDPLLALLPGPFRVPSPELTEEDLSADGLFNLLIGQDGNGLRPQYDPTSLAWMLAEAERLAPRGRLHKVLLRTAEGEVAGWYLYHLKPRDLSEVLHLEANPRREGQILDHLFRHARNHGAAGLNGRLQPGLAQALSDRRCFYHAGPQWFLVHSRRPELLRAFERGRASLSRLDGEWCLHFR